MKKQDKLRELFCWETDWRNIRKGICRKRIRTSFYSVSSSRLPAAFNGCRIAHLSDLHGALYGRHHQALVRRIQEAKPDYIVMTGDMADHTKDSVPKLEELCRRLRKRWPVYYIAGNHEQCLEKWIQARLYRQLRQAGAVVLENSWCTVSRGQDSLQIYGLVTPLVYYKDPLGEYKKGITLSARDVERYLGKADPNAYRILLAHNPLYFPSYRDWGADLTLSGHIHGGIIRIPGLGGLLSPDVSLFPRYDGGHFIEQGKHLVVSRGLGNHFLFRVCNPPELAVITLAAVPAPVQTLP